MSSDLSLVKLFDFSQFIGKDFFDDLILEFNTSGGVVSTSKSTFIDGIRLSRICSQWEIPYGNHVARLKEVVEYCVDTQYKEIIPKHYSMFIPKEYVIEGFRMKKYEAGEGKFDLHTDSNDSATASRFLGVLIYCNTVEQGGETIFLGHESNHSIQPKVGRMVVFPPFWTYPHCAQVPISGPKYIISTYLRFK